MRIVLFDPLTDGHHVEYAGHLARYLLEHGDAVELVAWAPAPRLEAIRSETPGLSIRFLTDRSERFGPTPARYYAEGLWAVDRGIRLAVEHRAAVFHHLFIERAEVPMQIGLARRRRSLHAFGTLFWPYFRNPPDDPGALARSAHAANRLALRRMLRTRRLRGLFVHSDRIKEQVLAAIGHGVDPDRVVVVPDPATPPTGSREDARAWLGIPTGVPAFLFLGQLSERKGADLLLEALPLLEQEVEGDWRVVVAGLPGSIGRPEVDRSRSRLRRSERLVARLGFAADEDLDRLFLAADAVVLPYRRTHLGTSGILQRAAAAGKVAIASDVGDVGPTVRAHDLGLVVEPESGPALVDALRRFIDEREALEERIEPKALAYAAAAGWQTLGERVRANYLSAAGRDEPGRPPPSTSS